MTSSLSVRLHRARFLLNTWSYYTSGAWQSNDAGTIPVWDSGQQRLQASKVAMPAVSYCRHLLSTYARDQKSSGRAEQEYQVS